MDEPLSIGAFSELTGITQRALRLYDERGLLTPAAVDPANGYRWYERAQLERAEVIGAARSIGMPLAEIGALLADGPEEAHRRLDRHADLVLERLHDARDGLARLHRLLARPDGGKTMDAFERGNKLYFHKPRDIEGALACYLEVAEGDPNYLTAQRYIGHNVYGREWSRWSEGLPYLENAFRLAPEDPKVLEDIGRAYVALGRAEEGRALLERAGTKVAAHAVAKLDRA